MRQDKALIFFQPLFCPAADRTVFHFLEHIIQSMVSQNRIYEKFIIYAVPSIRIGRYGILYIVIQYILDIPSSDAGVIPARRRFAADIFLPITIHLSCVMKKADKNTDRFQPKRLTYTSHILSSIPHMVFYILPFFQFCIPMRQQQIPFDIHSVPILKIN